MQGKLVSLEEALDGCERILRDEFKDYPESALYMIGAVDEAKQKGQSGKGAGSDASGPAPEPQTEVEHAAADPDES